MMISKDLIRLIKNILVIGVLIAIGFLVYHFFFSSTEDELKIDDTPIHIESIRTIAEISTVSYQDEVVMDTVEFYKNDPSIYRPTEWLQLYDRNVKRRLTLIVKGEVKYGLDLTNSNFDIKSNNDSIWIKLPEPTILDVIVSPSKTEVFQEQGRWSDSDRKRLEAKAKNTLITNARIFKLEEKARINSERLFLKLIQTDKTLIISFDHER
jgi:hypothetical protein